MAVDVFFSVCTFTWRTHAHAMTKSSENMKKTSRLPPTIPYNTSPTRSPGQEMAIAALGDDLADLRYNHHTAEAHIDRMKVVFARWLAAATSFVRAQLLSSGLVLMRTRVLSSMASSNVRRHLFIAYEPRLRSVRT